jgi:predicted ATPase
VEKKMICIKKLKNFGVIEKIESEIKLNDLTIFMGDNSAGKSYMAMLIHSILIMRVGYEDENFLKAIKSKFKNSEVLKFLKKLVNDILHSNDNKILNAELNEKSISEMYDIIKFAINDYLVPKYLVYKIFSDDILKEIEIDLSSVDKYLVKQFSLNIKNDINKRISINTDASQSILEFPNMMPKDKDFVKNGILNNLIHLLIEIPLRKMWKLSNSIYLPASRTGYLQTYPILANQAIIKTYNGVENEKQHKLSLILQDFILKLNMITKIKDTEFNKFIEKNMIMGKVSLSEKDNSINYKTNDGIDIDINFLSSTISELMPLIIFLKKGFISQNSLLIIEEPEAHLSFKNQKLMASLIAIFLKHNIKVLITTHSDFLITEINNLILKNSINSLKKENIYDLSINYKKVNVYNFLLQENEKSIVKKVKIDKEGIDNDYIFDNIYEIIKEKNNLIEELDKLDEN